MKPKRLCNILVCLLCSCSAAFCAPQDSIYQGTMVKLDIASPIIVPAMNNWQMQHYEIAANVRLAKRFYPTIELGYAGGKTQKNDTLSYNAHGGFFRVGCDINPLKKHPESPHALLVGVRLGTGVQPPKVDCWGEIVVGCQVEMAKVQRPTSNDQRQMSFYMGWMGRLKCLFTRYNALPLSAQEDGSAKMIPIYISGYGTRDNIGWGVNYYLGWRF